MPFWAAVAILILLLALPGCRAASAAVSPPIPPEYYDCTETTPSMIVDACYNSHTLTLIGAQLYDGRYFVFKDVEVTELMFKHIDEGYFWADRVKCECLHAQDMLGFEAGDLVDVVGKNQGIAPDVAALVFTGCIILPAGSVQLPAPGGGGIQPVGY